MPTESDIRALSGALQQQARWCEAMGSPLYAALLDHSAGDVEMGGPISRLLEGHAADPLASALALRLMGAVHRLVLGGEAPTLAAHYPSTGGDGDAERAWPIFQALVADRLAELAPLVERGVQTNEVGRSCALAPGFLWIARASALPLSCLEIGASAGLNLRWDQYRYEAPDAGWGDRAARVRFTGAWVEGRPPFDAGATVIERRGCDRAPLDPGSPADRVTLAAYIWADQRERLETLRHALDVATRLPAPIDGGDAPDWLAEQLAIARPEIATVVFHSIVWQYLSDDTRRRIGETIHAAGARATRSAPLFWLRLEPGQAQAELRCTRWPEGTDDLLARSGFHGRDVRWLVD